MRAVLSSAPSDATLIGRVRAGDRAAFDELVAPHMTKLRAVIRRMVAHPEDTEDLTQDTLLRAFQKIRTFRGDANVGSWLCSIGTRRALDYLRRRKRWRLQALEISKHECNHDVEMGQAVRRAVSRPDHQYDASEHVAFCFTCVARTLAPDDMTALMVRDVGGYSTDEAAAMVGTTTSILRHRLSTARKQMQSRFEGLCALVSKNGVCWQCEELRAFHSADRRGPPVPDLTGADAEKSYRRRLQVVRSADIDRGRSQALHDVAWRSMARNEEARAYADVIAGRGAPEERADHEET